MPFAESAPSNSSRSSLPTAAASVPSAAKVRPSVSRLAVPPVSLRKSPITMLPVARHWPASSAQWFACTLIFPIQRTFGSPVGVIVGVNVGDGVRVGVGVDVGDAVGVAVGVSVRVAVGDAVAVAVRVGVGVRVGGSGAQVSNSSDTLSSS